MKNFLVSISITLAGLSLIPLTGFYHSNSNRTDIALMQLVKADDETILEFFNEYEALLVSANFELASTYAVGDWTDGWRIFDGHLDTCRAALLNDRINLKCIESRRPFFQFFVKRTSDIHDDLVAKIVQFAEPYGVDSITQTYFNTAVQEFQVSEFLDLR